MNENVLTFREPPHSTEAEQSLIGAVLLDNQAFDAVSWLAADAFYADQHRRAWASITKLVEAGKAADIVTVAEDLGDDAERAGGMTYLASLTQTTPTAYNSRRYAEIVRDKAIFRKLAQAGTEIAEKALSGAGQPMELAEEAAGLVIGIQVERERREAVEFGQAMVEALEKEDNPVKGVPTGYAALDNIVRGLAPGDLIIVAGRPSMGKTALAMNIAEHVAETKTVLVFSLEMTRAKIAGRSIRYHRSVLGRDGAVDHLAGLKLHIDDSPAPSLGQMRMRMRKVQRKHGLGMVVVDYLQLVPARGENRTQEVSTVSRGLKALAKDFDVPVVAVAQLNRAAETRTDSRPVLADLRESGQIEQDADVIAFVYREDYYKPDTPWRDIAEVIVRKNRDGAIGTAYLRWSGEYTRFHHHDGPLPQREEPARQKVTNFSDFKNKAAGE